MAFYNALGLKLIVYAKHGYARFECPGGATFSLDKEDGPIPDHPTTIFFECEDLDQTVAKLKSKGVVFERDPFDQPYLWREAHLRDPDGNRIRLYWAGENRLNPPWRLKDEG